MQKKWGFLCVLGAFFWGSTVVRAASIVLPANDISNGPRLIAGEDRMSAASNNLASASFAQSYTLGLGYSMAGDQMNVGIVDTSRPGIGGGVYYSRKEFKTLSSSDDLALGSFTRLEQTAILGLSAKLGDNISASVSGKYKYLRPFDSGIPPYSFWTIDVGIAAKLSTQWMLGLTAKDLIAQEQGLNYRSFEVGIIGEVSPGFHVLGQVDFHKAPSGSLDSGFVEDTSKPSIKLGVDYNVTSNIELFAHFANLPNWQQNYTALGMAYQKDSYNLQYAFRFSTKTSSAQYHMIALSMDL